MAGTGADEQQGILRHCPYATAVAARREIAALVRAMKELAEEN